jgi:protein-tyrosine phosphatase
MATVYGECVECWDSPAPWNVIGHETDCIWNDPDYVSDDSDALSDALWMMEGASMGKKKVSGFKFGSYVRQCSHAMDTFVLADGTSIYLSAHYDKRASDATADLAFYCDRAWVPDTIAYSVPWPDFGLPNLSDAQVLTLARTALDAARAGQVVEVGCLGAHGRTGTFAAVVYLLSMASPDASTAIAAVRMGHCSKAIENGLQEWFVAHVARILRGEPRKPYRAAKKAARKVHAPRKSARARGARTKK